MKQEERSSSLSSGVERELKIRTRHPIHQEMMISVCPIQWRHWPMGCQQCHGHERDAFWSISFPSSVTDMGWMFEGSRSQMEF
jgi:hypothetical protein